MSVRRYEHCALEGFACEHSEEDYVLASDYAALAARLAEAERLLQHSVSLGFVNGTSDWQMAVYSFLKSCTVDRTEGESNAKD